MVKTLSDDTIKTVNIFAGAPIDCGFAVPFIGRIMYKQMTVKDILRCIQARAKVEEVLPNGKTVKLGYSNYNTDNTVTEVKKEIIPTLTPIPIKKAKPISSTNNSVQNKKETPIAESTTAPIESTAIKEANEEVKQTEPVKEETVIDEEEEEIRRMIEEDEKNND